MIAHAELMLRFDGERSLPDAAIENTTENDWTLVLDALRSRPWTVDCGDHPLPATASALFSLTADEAVTVKVQIATGVQINIFPLSTTSIDFDFDTAELRSQHEVDALTDFIATLGRLVRKAVVVTHEGSPTALLFEFDPAANQFRLGPTAPHA